MDDKNEELVDAQIVEEDSRVYGHAEGEPGGEVADEPVLVLGDDDPHDAELHEKILSEECAWKGKILDVHRLEVELPNGHRSARDIIRHPGAAAVVALTESGKIVLVRQYRTAIDRDLAGMWNVVAEGIQTILRREGYPHPYETLKALTRTNTTVTAESISEFIDTLEVSDSVRAELHALTPSTYTGF